MTDQRLTVNNDRCQEGSKAREGCAHRYVCEQVRLDISSSQCGLWASSRHLWICQTQRICDLIPDLLNQDQHFSSPDVLNSHDSFRNTGLRQWTPGTTMWWRFPIPRAQYWAIYVNKNKGERHDERWSIYFVTYRKNSVKIYASIRCSIRWCW